jgi:hypothetical protein
MSTPVIPALGKLTQEDHEIHARQGYRERPCLKKKQREGGGTMDSVTEK